jgi:hypothetical protein
MTHVIRVAARGYRLNPAFLGTYFVAYATLNNHVCLPFSIGMMSTG